MRALKFRSQREGILGKSHCCQPDSGNPTVRDERGACGNTDKENSKRARKAETLKQSSIFLSCSAPYFYPTTDAFTRNSNTSSAWFSRNGESVGAWFEVFFNMQRSISGLSINQYSASSYKITKGWIDIYDDGGAVLYSQEHDLPGNPSQISLPVIDNVSRVRLTAVQTTSQTYIGIREFEVFAFPRKFTGTNINTSISAGTPVSILIKDSDGNTVRTLVNNQYRDMGSYSDHWDCKDDNGIVVNDGVHYAILQYIVDGQS